MLFRMRGMMSSSSHIRWMSSVGLVGCPNVGKSSLFNALTRTQQAQSSNYPFCTIDPNEARVAVPDPKLQQISEIAGSRKVIDRTISFVDIAGLVQGAHEGKGLGNQFLGDIRTVDVIMHVVRCFENDDIIHVESSVDPVRDLQVIRNELVLADLQSVEKKLAANAKKRRSGDAKAKLLQDTLQRCQQVLENGECLSWERYEQTEGDTGVDLTEQWNLVISSLSLLSCKPELIVMNVDEDSAVGGNDLTRALQRSVASESTPCLPLCVQLEEEASGLEDEAAQEEFLSLAGVKMSSLNTVVQQADRLLDTTCFYTVGPQEARSWPISAGSTAARAAGKIHSDFETGFVRAEVVSFNDYIANEGIAGARKSGACRQEGKGYIVESGDIITFATSASSS